MRLLTCVPLLVATVLLMSSCKFGGGKKEMKLVWSKNIGMIGSQSSPRTTDINKDGILDIVMGAGKNEFQESDMGILAINGKDGNILWQQHAIDQVFGSALFCDVNGDSIQDVFIGGRSPQLKGLDGKTGNILWEFDTAQYVNDPVVKHARFNFNNGVLIRDQSGDGIDDILTVNGGNALASPYQTRNRFPGVLMILDSKTGKVIAADTMPDGKESYITPLAFSQPGSDELNILFGTGGETIDGSLYVATIDDLKSRKLSAAKKIADDKGHGFIAPATLADINADDYLDIIVITHGSKAIAIDGKDYHTIWTKSFPGTECSNSFAVGYFTDDDVPDFFTFVSKGVWPNSAGSMQVMLDGRNGNVEYTDSIGCTGFSSPVVYDLNDDGTDEVLLSINEFDCSLGYAGKWPSTVINKLISIDFDNEKKLTIDQTKGFKNVFSTPWIGDLDNDGHLDIIHCQYFHHNDLLSFLGMAIKRIDTPVEINDKVKWGSFLGSNSNGIFLGEK